MVVLVLVRGSSPTLTCTKWKISAPTMSSPVIDGNRCNPKTVGTAIISCKSTEKLQLMMFHEEVFFNNWLKIYIIWCTLNVSSPYLSMKTNTVKFGRKHRCHGIMDVLLTNEVTEVVKCPGLGPNANMSKFLKLFTCQMRSHRLLFLSLKWVFQIDKASTKRRGHQPNLNLAPNHSCLQLMVNMLKAAEPTKSSCSWKVQTKSFQNPIPYRSDDISNPTNNKSQILPLPHKSARIDNLKSQLITPYLTCQPTGLAANTLKCICSGKSLDLQLVLLMVTSLSAHWLLMSTPHLFWVHFVLNWVAIRR